MPQILPSYMYQILLVIFFLSVKIKNVQIKLCLIQIHNILESTVFTIRIKTYSYNFTFSPPLINL